MEDRPAYHIDCSSLTEFTRKEINDLARKAINDTSKDGGKYGGRAVSHDYFSEIGYEHLPKLRKAAGYVSEGEYPIVWKKVCGEVGCVGQIRFICKE